MIHNKENLKIWDQFNSYIKIFYLKRFKQNNFIYESLFQLNKLKIAYKRQMIWWIGKIRKAQTSQVLFIVSNEIQQT